MNVNALFKSKVVLFAFRVADGGINKNLTRMHGVFNSHIIVIFEFIFTKRTLKLLTGL